MNAERLEELLILNRPNRPEEDVKDSVLPRSYRQEWWDWECTKNEFQNIGSVTGSESFVDENEAVNRILQVVCRDEIAMGITYKLAKEPDAHKDDRASAVAVRCAVATETKAPFARTRTCACKRDLADGQGKGDILTLKQSKDVMFKSRQTSKLSADTCPRCKGYAT